MTIASHCIELLKDRGPLTPDELGEGCRAAGVTRAANPAASVSSALSWYQDGRALRVGDRWHLVADLLDGRWLTFERPSEPLAFEVGLDLAPLRGLARHGGIPLIGGGAVSCTGRGYWSFHDRALPDAALLGLKMHHGLAELADATLDPDAELRGERLAARVLAARPSQGYMPADADRAAALLGLLAEDDDLLRTPVPPLSQLLPQPAPPSWPTWEERARHVPPGFRQMHVALPNALYEDLDTAAAERGMSASELVSDELHRMASWPWRARRWEREPVEGTIVPLWPDAAPPTLDIRGGPLDRDPGA